MKEEDGTARGEAIRGLNLEARAARAYRLFLRLDLRWWWEKFASHDNGKDCGRPRPEMGQRPYSR